MTLTVSSSFISGLIDKNPDGLVRRFLIGTSDYTDRVTRWPSIKKTASEIKSATITIPVANTDGAFNTFHSTVYSLVNTVQLQIGLNTDSGSPEYADIYTGQIKSIKYGKSGLECQIISRDSLWNLSQSVVGTSDAPASWDNVIPSDIVWDLCTCYGGFDNTASSSNTNINYTSFQSWALAYSRDNVTISAQFDGSKVLNACNEVLKLTMSTMWTGGDGKLNFARFNETSSLDMILTRDDIDQFDIDVDGLSLINNQVVQYDYKIESNYWAGVSSFADAGSINSYGLYTDIIESEAVWYVDSISAGNFSERMVGLYKDPPKQYEIETGLKGLQRDISETVRLVDSFFAITSASGWRITEHNFMMQTGTCKIVLDGAVSKAAFYLDIDSLDNLGRFLL